MQSQASKTQATTPKISQRYEMRFPIELGDAINIAIALEQSPDTIAQFLKEAALEKVQRVYKKHKLTAPAIKFRKRGDTKKKLENSTCNVRTL